MSSNKDTAIRSEERPSYEATVRVLNSFELPSAAFSQVRTTQSNAFWKTKIHDDAPKAWSKRLQLKLGKSLRVKESSEKERDVHFLDVLCLFLPQAGSLVEQLVFCIG